MRERLAERIDPMIYRAKSAGLIPLASLCLVCLGLFALRLDEPLSAQASQAQPKTQGLASPAPSRRTSYCANVKRGRYIVLRIERYLGCRSMRRLAWVTVKNSGYLKTQRFYCRWGGGSAQFPSKVINGREYFFGYCLRISTGKEARFYGRIKR